jgi:membrane associated rhomboid family serine protease
MMFQQTPQVVKNLILLNALVFIATNLVMGEATLVPLLAGTYPGSPFFEPWQIVTHMFMHGDLTHIFFNMFALYMFGSQLERVWGAQRFLTYYMACGLGAFALHELVVGLGFYSEFGTFFPQPEQFVHPSIGGVERVRVMELVYGRVVGASGAVFGLLLAFGMLFPNTQLMLLFPPIPIRAKYFVLGYGAIELLLALQNSPGDNVAHFAHLGGMVFGYILLKRWQQDRGHFY